MPLIETNVSVLGALPLTEQVRFLTLPPQKRKRLLMKLAKKVRSFSRKRIREQKNLEGQRFQPRKNKRKRKMLRGLSRLMTASSDANKGVVKYKNALTGKIAFAHQAGINEVMTASKAARVNGVPDYDAPPSRNMAKRLINAGYKVKRKTGKGTKSPSIRWVTENLNQGQAGFLIKSLESTHSKQRWNIELPERSFLGVTEQELKILSDELIKQQQR